MKKITFTIGMLVTLLFVSCGRDGLDGLNGLDGVNILGNVIEVQGSFTEDNDYSFFYEFPQTVEVLESDVVLVYLLWDQTTDSNGDAVDIWRLLPQTRLLNQGILQYNFEHTFFDVDFFLEADFDLGTLNTADTDDQVFRIAILPADFASSKIDKNNMASVMDALSVKEQDISRVIIE